jgi:hypothetical protein
MPSSEYFRIQAEQCLHLARRCQAPGIADGLTALASNYLRDAERLGPKPVPQQQQQTQPKKEG